MGNKISKSTQDFYEEIGGKIRQCRRDLNQNQETIAKLAQMSRQSYILIEAGKKKATVHQLYLIANALKIKIDKILLPLDNALKILRPDIEKFDNLTKKWFNKKEMDEIIETISEKEE